MELLSNILLSPSSSFPRKSAWFIAATLLSVVVFWAPSVFALSIDVSPVILDWEGQRKDEFSQEISITNNTGRVVTVWPIVADINPETGDFSIANGPGDSANLFSTWVSLRRTNIYLTPGKTKTVNLKVRSRINTDPGTYYGIVAFPIADSFDDAEQKIEGAGKTSVTVRVLENRKEQLNIERFGALKRVLLSFPVSVVLQVGNGGNVDTALEGSIRFYDRHDNEIGESRFSGDTIVGTGQTESVSVDWSGGGTFGRHKALIELTYGKANIVTDSTIFYVIPWWALAVFFGFSILAVILVTRLISRAHRHHQ